MNDRASEQHILLGKISGVFGVRGWVKVYSYTDLKENIVNYSPWYIRREDAWHPVKVLDGRSQGKTVVAQLESVEDRNSAEELIGCEIFVTHDQLPALVDNEFYWSQLEGLNVFTVTGELLGVVDYLIDTGANDVLVVKTAADTSECLIPFVMEQFVHSVDLDSGKIVVDWNNDY